MIYKTEMVVGTTSKKELKEMVEQTITRFSEKHPLGESEYISKVSISVNIEKIKVTETTEV
ncbi:MAG: hypothetical protein ACTSXO_01130 [Candidatus Heimdallarchaeota archaeon]